MTPAAPELDVVWNGSRTGRTGGYLLFNPAILERSALEQELDAAGGGPVVLESRRESAWRVREALRERGDDGAMMHELAQELAITGDRVNATFYELQRIGLASSRRMERAVWTGHRWAWHRYFWKGDH